MPEEQESGATLLARKEYWRAIPLLKAEHEKYPTNPRILLQYADALAGAGLLNEAAIQYEKTARYYDDNGLTVQAIAVRKKAERAAAPPSAPAPVPDDTNPLTLITDEEVAVQAAPPSYLQRDRVIANAEKLVAKGRVEPAIHEYERLLADNPDDVNTLNRIGDLWVRINRNDEAVEVFTRIADHYATDGFFLKAIAIYKKINKLDPSRLNVYERLADLYARQGLAMEAKSQYQSLADYHLKRGDAAEVLRIYRRMSELDPNSINVHVKLADLYAQTGHAGDAAREYRRVAEVLQKRGMHDEAAQVLAKLRNLQSGNVDASTRAIASAVAALDYDGAAQTATTLLRSASDPPALLAGIRDEVAKSSGVDAAITLMDSILEQDSGLSFVLDALIDLHLGEGDTDAALERLRPSIDDALREGRSREALGFLNRILKSDANHQPTIDLLARTEAEWMEERPVVDLLRSYARALAERLAEDPGTGRRYVRQRLETGIRTLADAVSELQSWIADPSPGTAVVIDEPGTGKTTLLRELALRLCNGEHAPIPILVELRGTEPASVEALINAQLASEVSPVVIRRLLERGMIVLLFDGLDEIAAASLDHRVRRLNAITAFAAAGRAKAVVTTRPQSGLTELASSAVPLRIYMLPAWDYRQMRAYLRECWGNEALVEQWFELLERMENLRLLCSKPSILRLAGQIDANRLFDGGKLESDAVSGAEVYRLLFEKDYGPKGLAWDALCLLAEQAVLDGAMSISRAVVTFVLQRFGLPERAFVSGSLVYRDHRGDVFFAHPSVIEWLIALTAATQIASGSEPVLLSKIVMTGGVVEFFCDLAGYENARRWASAQRHRNELYVQTNAEAVIELLGAGHVATPGDTPPPLAQSKEADDHEQKARALLTEHQYRAAIDELNVARSVDETRGPRIDGEFGFLFTHASSTERTAETRLRWCTDVWRTLTGRVNLPTSESRSDDAMPAQAPAAEPAVTPAVKPPTRAHAQAAGEELEEAALRLFRQFFSLAEEVEGEFRVELQKLRRQKAGSQFGYDIAFDATVAGAANVRCHVECKNYTSAIALKDVADKLLQQKSHGVAIDHWILISPRSDPSADLHHFLEYESKALEFPFDIHVWSPETNVAQFFALEPALYDKFYDHPAGELHPRDWPDEKKRETVDRIRRQLRPVYRLPDGWREYVEHEANLCFSSTELHEFERTYATAVPLGGRDRNGLDLPGSAMDRLESWLADPSQRVALVLGEFGDGKSFLTYSLSRRLLETFRKSPAQGVIPLRLALREFSAARSVREFLEARLEYFGADLAGWAAVRKQHRALVILDGFDEISKELDPATITHNIRALIDCCSASVFEGCKILITSRTHFFESGDAQRLLERLDDPLLLQLARIPRGEVLGHLQDAARGPEERQLLQRLARMHDPIGLGTKPLFLQMLKETLHSLPADLDEISVYDSYARKSLERKIELLDDPEFRASRDDSVQQLLDALGVIAEELQCSRDPYVSLKNLRERTGPFAELLWRLSGEERLESDAEARLGTRSLLSRVNALEGDGRWLVDFCHRSIREYFVARRFAACLTGSASGAAEFLQRIPVNHEILYFTACLLRRSRDSAAVENLRELIGRSRTREDAHALAGTALTVLLRVAPALPRDVDFTNRNFDLADLEDGDLSQLDFSGSTFRNANFANANLEDANLSGCDLTGVRLHETTAVLAVAAPSSGRIFAAYEDATVWEWNASGGGKPSSRIVFAEQGLKLSRIGVTKSGVAWAIAGRTALLFEITPAEWRCVGRIALEQACSDFTADDGSIAMLLAEKNVRCRVVDLERQGISLQKTMPESSVFAAPAPELLCFRENESAIRLAGSTAYGSVDCAIPTGNATALDVFIRGTGQVLVAVGEGDGTVRVFDVAISAGAATPSVMFEQQIHSGPVLAVKFSGALTVVSGGLDRRIALTPLRSDVGAGNNLQLNLRCRGLKIDGVTPEAQRLRIEELKARASA